VRPALPCSWGRKRGGGAKLSDWKAWSLTWHTVLVVVVPGSLADCVPDNRYVEALTVHYDQAVVGSPADPGPDNIPNSVGSSGAQGLQFVAVE
jgi:hypothetical protein